MTDEIDVPIKVVHLFPALDEKLLELLRSLNAEEWHKPTIAKRWQVKDIAAHLLDGNLRTLSASRDHYFEKAEHEINTYEALLNHLNTLNADWVRAMRRVSPQVLIELLATTGKAFSTHMSMADLRRPSIYPVSWAGENESLNWFHIAREYTEKWIHQQQIRNAVGKEGVMTKKFFSPFIETFMRGLPHTYRKVEAKLDTIIKITVTTNIGDNWYLRKLNNGWTLIKEPAYAANAESPSAELFIDPETAWKLFSKGITPLESKKFVEIRGNYELAATALTMISVMA